MEKQKLNNKAQFYFFAAIILISFVFAIASSNPKISKTNIENYQNYLDNYKQEAYIVINNAVYENKNISYELRNYTEYFISYADSKALDISLIYMYSNSGYIHIVNYLNQPVLINPSGITLQTNHETRVDFNESITLKYQNESYSFYFSRSDEIEFRTLIVGG